MTRDLISQFINIQPLAVFGSISPEQKPQAALVGIAATPDLEVIFDTLRSSRKYRNLIQQPDASLVIGCAGEVTVQFEGTAREVSGAGLERYQQIYFSKWPDAASRLSWPGIAYIVVKPRWIRYCDFNSHPPLIDELVFP